MAMTGNYDGPLCPKGGAACFPNIAQAIGTANIGGQTVVVASTNTTLAVAAAKAADAVVLVVDNFKDGGGEGHDRYTISLSDSQKALASAVIGANQNCVLVLVNGGMISIDELTQSAPAILEVRVFSQTEMSLPVPLLPVLPAASVMSRYTAILTTILKDTHIRTPMGHNHGLNNEL